MRLTRPLEGNEGADGLPVLSDGYRLCELVETFWVVKGRPLVLDQWQRELLIRILERRPDTHRLRYRQVVVSIPRQAGKSLLAAILALYGLLQHCHAPKVLGVARSVQQANVVYGYTADAIAQSEALAEVLHPTGTRGISQLDGLGTYKVLPAKPEAVQGYESTLSICDELHVMQPKIWNAIVESQTAQTEPLLIGITTAGDMSSVLLKSLYEQGETAIAGGRESFGFFVYESKSNELTAEALAEANPAIACGRIDVNAILADCAGQPPSQWMQFRLNRFIEGLAEPWVPVEAWATCAGAGLEDFTGCTYAIEIGPGMAYATIAAAKKIDGRIHTSTVCRLVAPKLDDLKAWALRLRAAGKCTFILDGSGLTLTLSKFLEEKRYDVTRVAGRGARGEAAGIVYAAIVENRVRHDNQPLVNTQHSHARLKSTPNGSVITASAGREIDAAYASTYAIYGAEIKKERGLLVA